jgi:hypothetical protein
MPQSVNPLYANNRLESPVLPLLEGIENVPLKLVREA